MNNTLSHHGILGQKWGVRRYQNKDGSLTSAGKKLEPLEKRVGKSEFKESHDDYKKAHQKKEVRTMSDAELRTRINRLQMEQQYSKLNTNNIGKGKKCVDAMIKGGTTIATVTTTALTIYNNSEKIKSIIEKKLKK